MHGDVTLGGPLWMIATFLILAGVLFAVFVLIDSVRPARRAKVASAGQLREPLWIYTVLNAAFLGTLLVVQFVPGLQLAAAIPAIATPFVLAAGAAYLLRVVFPKSDTGVPNAPSVKTETPARTPESEEFDPFAD